jgi:hypothetical protein
MKPQPSSSSPLALFAGACLVAATGCSIAIPGVRMPGGSTSSSSQQSPGPAQSQGSQQSAAVDPNDPCALPPPKRTNEQHAWCEQQASQRRREQDLAREQGQADAEKQAREAILSRAVVGKLEGLIDEDAVDPRKVAEVLGKVTPELLVRLAPGGSAVYAPAGPWESNGRQCQEPAHTGTTPALSEFGAALVSDFEHTSDAHRRPRQTPRLECNDKKAQRNLTPNDPAVVWAPFDKAQNRVVLIGLDGSRYVAHVSWLLPGAPEKSTWPTSAPNPVLYPDDVTLSAERGKFPKEQLAGVVGARKKYESCYASVAPKYQKQIEQIQQSGGLYSARDAKLRPVGVAWDSENRKQCGKAYEAFIPAAKKFMAEEKARREKLYQETVTRLKQ